MDNQNIAASAATKYVVDEQDLRQQILEHVRLMNYFVSMPKLVSSLRTHYRSAATRNDAITDSIIRTAINKLLREGVVIRFEIWCDGINTARRIYTLPQVALRAVKETA